MVTNASNPRASEVDMSGLTDKPAFWPAWGVPGQS